VSALLGREQFLRVGDQLVGDRLRVGLERALLDRLADALDLGGIEAAVTGGQGAYLWAGILAQRGILTDPTFYFAKNDPLYDGVAPTAIVSPTNRGTLDPSFVAKPDLSFELVGGLRMSDAPTTPVAFTRGLLANGTWDATNAVYKDTGGHIAFLGGNIQFYPNLTEAAAQLTLNNGKKGSALLQALPLTARVYGTGSARLGTVGGTPAQHAP